MPYGVGGVDETAGARMVQGALRCPECGGRMRLIALISEDQLDVMKKILRSMGQRATSPLPQAAQGLRSSRVP